MQTFEIVQAGEPLDKEGAGSRILGSSEAIDAIDAKEMKRQRDFTRKTTHMDGTSRLGLGPSELRSYLDASFERATGRRRPTDRTLLMGEWHVRVKVMGKAGSTSGYPSLRDVEDLFTRNRLRARMTQRLRSKWSCADRCRSRCKSCARGQDLRQRMPFLCTAEATASEADGCQQPLALLGRDGALAHADEGPDGVGLERGRRPPGVSVIRVRGLLQRRHDRADLIACLEHADKSPACAKPAC